MSIDYSYALEKRRLWLEWSKKTSILDMEPQAKQIYISNLEQGDTYFMNKRFCELVDYARGTLPEDLAFEKEWVITPRGWMLLEEPFSTPCLGDAYMNELDTKNPIDEILLTSLRRASKDLKERIPISAIGWMQVPDNVIDARNKMIAAGELEGRIHTYGATQFCCYFDYGFVHNRGVGFGMWSYFVINPGEKVLERIQEFEHNVDLYSNVSKVFVTSTNSYIPGSYEDTTDTLQRHEVRWIFTAFHLMSQRLAIVKDLTATRGTRRRFERDRVPLTPEYKVVALRRMEEARAMAGVNGEHKDWHWQWKVKGHWHKYFYPSEGIHRNLWVEDYIKGPTDKPMKPPTNVIYKAVR